jgi:hypothetical protein
VKKFILYCLFLFLGIVTPEVINKFNLDSGLIDVEILTLEQALNLYTKAACLNIVTFALVSWFSIFIFRYCNGKLSALFCSLCITLPSFIYGCLMQVDNIALIIGDWHHRSYILLRVFADIPYILWLPTLYFMLAKNLEEHTSLSSNS